jgi:hypothetical protein
MQTGSSETLIGWKSGKTTFVPLMGPNGGRVAMDSEVSKNNELHFAAVSRIFHEFQCDFRDYFPSGFESAESGVKCIAVIL